MEKSRRDNSQFPSLDLTHFAQNGLMPKAIQFQIHSPGAKHMLRTLCCFTFMSLVLGASVPMSFAEDADTTVYELRTYTTHPGRLPALNKRFRDHTMKLFEKHGMTNVMYWTPVDKENTLIYILKHDSPEAAKKSWAGFRGDPAWNQVKTESEKDAPIVMKVESVYMKTTDYSPKPAKD